MSRILEDRIRAVMEGKQLTEDKKHESDAIAKKASGVEDSAKGPAAEQAKKTAKDNEAKLDKVGGKGGKDFEPSVPRAGEGDKDAAKVVEGSIPDLGAELSGKPTHTTKDADNAKIQAKRSSSSEKAGLGKDTGVFKDKVKSDEQDDAGDNAKIQAKRSSSSEKSGKLKAEHFEALFDGEQLSEEFMMKAETLFEVALNHAVEARIAELQEEQLQEMSEAVEVVKGELVEQIDGYLDEIVEAWMNDNAVALESGMQVELTNSFIDGLKNVFQEHYVEVPEDKVNVVEEQASQIEELQAELASLQEQHEQSIAESSVLRCEEIISETAKGLTAMQAEKFKSLVEGIEFDTEEEFATKAKIIREAHFKDTSVSINNSQDVTKSITEDKTSYSGVNAVLAALQKGDLKFVR